MVDRTKELGGRSTRATVRTQERCRARSETVFTTLAKKKETVFTNTNENDENAHPINC